MTRGYRHIQKTVRLIRSNLELLSWITALLLLFFLPGNTNDTSLCFFSLLGFGRCLGCGIGHAIHYALRLQLETSFAYHPLGIFAVIIIFRRVKQLLYPVKKQYETQHAPPDPRH